MGYLYHTTYIYNIDSIKKRGLRISFGERSTFGGYGGHVKGKIFLSRFSEIPTWFHKLEHIARGETETPEEDGMVPVALRIDITGINFEVDPEVSSGKSFYAQENISPERIEVWTGSKWEAIRNVDEEALLEVVRDTVEEFYEEDDSSWTEIEWDILQPTKKASPRNVVANWKSQGGFETLRRLAENYKNNPRDKQVAREMVRERKRLGLPEWNQWPPLTNEEEWAVMDGYDKYPELYPEVELIKKKWNGYSFSLYKEEYRQRYDDVETKMEILFEREDEDFLQDIVETLSDYSWAEEFEVRGNKITLRSHMMEPGTRREIEKNIHTCCTAFIEKKNREPFTKREIKYIKKELWIR